MHDSDQTLCWLYQGWGQEGPIGKIWVADHESSIRVSFEGDVGPSKVILEC